MLEDTRGCERCGGSGWLEWHQRPDGHWTWPDDALVRWRGEAEPWGHPNGYTDGYCPVCPDCKTRYGEPAGPLVDFHPVPTPQFPTIRPGEEKEDYIIRASKAAEDYLDAVTDWHRTL